MPFLGTFRVKSTGEVVVASLVDSRQAVVTNRDCFTVDKGVVLAVDSHGYLQCWLPELFNLKHTPANER